LLALNEIGEGKIEVGEDGGPRRVYLTDA